MLDGKRKIWRLLAKSIDCSVVTVKNYYFSCLHDFLLYFSFPSSIDTLQRELAIPKYSLMAGVYIVKLSVTIKALGYSESDQCYLEIKEVPLISKITGGSLRMLPWNQDIVLDASASYDPNILNEGRGSTDLLTFKWYCKVKKGQLPFPLGDGGCFGYGNGLVEHIGPIWKIKARTMLKNVHFIFTVIVSNSQFKTREGSSSQTIVLKSGEIYKAEIRYLLLMQYSRVPYVFYFKE